MLRLLRRKGARRIVFVCFGVALVATGVSTLAGGRPAYRNYKGQWVFPPVAIALGIGAVVLAFRTPRPRAKNTKRSGTR